MARIVIPEFMDEAAVAQLRAAHDVLHDAKLVDDTGANALSVAEYVVTTALLLLRGAYGSSASVAAGAWPRAALCNGREIGGWA